MRHWTESLLEILKYRYPGVFFNIFREDDRYSLYSFPSEDQIELSEVSMRYDPGAGLQRLYQRIELGKTIQNFAQTLVLKYEASVWWAD